MFLPFWGSIQNQLSVFICFICKIRYACRRCFRNPAAAGRQHAPRHIPPPSSFRAFSPPVWQLTHPGRQGARAEYPTLASPLILDNRDFGTRNNVVRGGIGTTAFIQSEISVAPPPNGFLPATIRISAVAHKKRPPVQSDGLSLLSHDLTGRKRRQKIQSRLTLQ